MKVTIMSIPVLDQEQARKFYTEKLGFVVKHDTPLGGGNRWLTVVSKEDPTGIEILLEPGPLHFKPCKVYQDALMEVGMPYTQFDVESVDAEYERLTALGVEFKKEPVIAGPVKYAILNDTCVNYIQLVENLEES